MFSIFLHHIGHPGFPKTQKAGNILLHEDLHVEQNKASKFYNKNKLFYGSLENLILKLPSYNKIQSTNDNTNIVAMIYDGLTAQDKVNSLQ